MKAKTVKQGTNLYSLLTTTKEGEFLIELVEKHERKYGHQVIIQAKERASININQVFWNATSITAGNKGLAL